MGLGCIILYYMYDPFLCCGGWPALALAPTSFQVSSRPPHTVICEEHNEALAEWYYATRSGVLRQGPEGQGSGLTIIHFDSHPDLYAPAWTAQHTIDEAVGQDVGGSRRGVGERAERLAAAAEIDSFILLAAQIGLVRHVIWVRPPWSDALSFDGRLDFNLSLANPKTENSRSLVDLPIPYFIVGPDRNVYAENVGGEEQKSVPIRLDVVPLSDFASKVQSGELGVHSHTARQSLVMDIDLDGMVAEHPVFLPDSFLDFFGGGGWVDVDESQDNVAPDEQTAEQVAEQVAGEQVVAEQAARLSTLAKRLHSHLNFVAAAGQWFRRSLRAHGLDDPPRSARARIHIRRLSDNLRAAFALLDVAGLADAANADIDKGMESSEVTEGTEHVSKGRGGSCASALAAVLRLIDITEDVIALGSHIVGLAMSSVSTSRRPALCSLLAKTLVVTRSSNVDEGDVTDMDKAFGELHAGLRALQMGPGLGLVTISRSVGSGFTPAQLAPHLERQILSQIRQVFGARGLRGSKTIRGSTGIQGIQGARGAKGTKGRNITSDTKLYIRRRTARDGDAVAPAVAPEEPETGTTSDAWLESFRRE